MFNNNNNNNNDRNSLFYLDDNSIVIESTNRRLQMQDISQDRLCVCHKAEKIHDNSQARNQLVAVSVLCTLFMIGEILGGIFANSLALISDALHLASDLAGFLISLLALWLAKRPASGRMTFGFYRAEVVGALISVLVIWIVTAILVYAAVDRVRRNNYDIDSKIMLITASCGVAFNIIMGLVLHMECIKCSIPHGHSHDTSPIINANEEDFVVQVVGNDDLGGGNNNNNNNNKQKRIRNINVNAAFIHVVGDFVQSVGVLISAIIIKIQPKYKLADPICTFVFSVIVIITTLKILRDVLVVFMEGTLNVNQVNLIKSDIERNTSIKNIHDLHIWALTTTRQVATVHIVVSNINEISMAKRFTTDLLKNKYQMTKTTIQVDVCDMDCESCCNINDSN